MNELKRMDIDLNDLELAWDPIRSPGGEVVCDWYLNVENGSVIMINDDMKSSISIMEDEACEIAELASKPFISVFHETPQFQNSPDWMKESLIEAIAVTYAPGDATRYVEIPKFSFGDRVQTARDFIAQLPASKERNALETAMREPKPLKYFRNAVQSDQRLESQWHQFESQWQRQRIIEWLTSLGITPANVAVV